MLILFGCNSFRTFPQITEKPLGTLRGVGYKDSFQWVSYDSLADTASYGSQPRTDAPALAGRWKATKADLTYFKSISTWWDAAGEGIMRDLGIRYTPNESQIMATPHLDVLASQPVELGLVKIKDIPIQADVPHHSVTVDLIVEVSLPKPPLEATLSTSLSWPTRLGYSLLGPSVRVKPGRRICHRLYLPS